MLNKLAKLADELDASGYTHQAEQIDKLIQILASEDFDDLKTELEKMKSEGKTFENVEEPNVNWEQVAQMTPEELKKWLKDYK